MCDTGWNGHADTTHALSLKHELLFDCNGLFQNDPVWCNISYLHSKGLDAISLASGICMSIESHKNDKQ
jgi:hypothetical protein